MKRLVLFFSIFFCLTACMEENIYNKKTTDPDPVPDNDFSFQIKDDITVDVTAISGDGTYSANIPVYFYGESPYDTNGEWKKNIFPVFYGVTASDGKLKASLTAISNETTLYIMPGCAGFGPIQTYAAKDGSGSVILQGTAPEYMPGTKSALRSEEESYPSIAVHPANQYNLYTFYEGATDTYNGQPAYTDGKPMPAAGQSLSATGAPLINYKNLVSYHESSRIATAANVLFPEKGMGFKNENKYLLEERYNTDLAVDSENGAEVWATYLGDGGFYLGNDKIAYNTLCYYHYKAGETPDPAKIRKTIVFPNTHPDVISCGTRVQLLYWDGSKYTTVFPKGTRIGWCFIRNGYGKVDDIPSNPNRFSAWRMKNMNNYRFSLASMNSLPRTQSNVPAQPTYNQAVALWNETLNCTIIGMENRLAITGENLTNVQDDDFNDVLFYVTSTPVIKPATDLNDDLDKDDPDLEEIKTKQFGTLAFEDMHPAKGDYDHNDVVIDYEYSLVKNDKAQLTAIELNFLVRATGGTRNAGFGIELPQLSNGSFTLSGEGKIDACSSPVIIVYEDVRKAFGSVAGILNTYLEKEYHTASPVNVRLDLNTPLPVEESNAITVLKFNPFIFVDSRENETHLVDYRPTSKGMLKFGTKDDKSDGLRTFYRTGEGYAWALDIPKISADARSWIYPREGISIVNAYPGYTQWATGDHKNISWLNYTEGIQENLYIPINK